jgi:trans-aconitate methyltransferase
MGGAAVAPSALVISRLRHLYFEFLYARRGDPWDYEHSEYERAKYGSTLAALDGRRFGRALEVGCSIGVFTEMLAPLCDELLAIDSSRRAVAQAERRLAGVPGVRVERRALPRQMPSGPFDLVVCSEVLYYLTRPEAVEATARIREELAPGGWVLAVHRLGKGRSSPLYGREVHELLDEHLGARRAVSRSTERYRLDVFIADGG